jgi:hypothetical protein
MKYVITQAQMEELGKILHDLDRLEIVFKPANGSGFLRDTSRHLYELLECIETQDVEDAT